MVYVLTNKGGTKGDATSQVMSTVADVVVRGRDDGCTEKKVHLGLGPCETALTAFYQGSNAFRLRIQPCSLRCGSHKAPTIYFVWGGFGVGMHTTPYRNSQHRAQHKMARIEQREHKVGGAYCFIPLNASSALGCVLLSG